MSDASPPSLKNSNVLQDLNSLITKFEDDGDPDLWFTDAKHPDLEVINDKVVRSSPNQVISSGIRKRIQNKKFGPKEESTLLQSSLLKDGEWLCLKCQFRSREKKVILYHIYSFHRKVILMCSKCPFKTEKSQELILHSNQHKMRHTEPLNGLKHSSINQITDGNTQPNVVTNENVFTSLPTRTLQNLNSDHGNTVKARQIGNTILLGDPSILFHNTTSSTNNTATGQQKYFHQCKHCGVGFSAISSLQEHMQESHQIKSVISKYNCSQCKFYGFKQEDVKTHFYQVHFSKTQQEQIVRSKPKFVRRTIPVTLSQPKPSIISVKRGPTVNSYGTPKAHICSICQKVFGTDIAMKTHLIMEEGFNQQCKYCKSVFKSGVHLEIHLKRCKKKTIFDGLQINAKPAIENSVIDDIEKDKSPIIGENKLSLAETCSSLLDILGTFEEDPVD